MLAATGWELGNLSKSVQHTQLLVLGFHAPKGPLMDEYGLPSFGFLDLRSQAPGTLYHITGCFSPYGKLLRDAVLAAFGGFKSPWLAYL